MLKSLKDAGLEILNPVDQTFDPKEHEAVATEPWTSIDSRLDASEIARRVKECLPKLPDAQRQVLILRDIEGADSAEVCDLLKISATNQRVLLHRARSHVRVMLELELGRG